MWLLLKIPQGVGTGEGHQTWDVGLVDVYHRQDPGGQQPEIQVVSHTKWTFYYINFSYNFRDNLPPQVSFTEQSPEIKSVLSCILKKKKKRKLDPCSGWEEGWGEVKESSEMRQKAHISRNFLMLSSPLHFVLCAPIPPALAWTPSLLPCHCLPHSKGAHSSCESHGLGK